MHYAKLKYKTSDGKETLHTFASRDGERFFEVRASREIPDTEMERHVLENEKEHVLAWGKGALSEIANTTFHTNWSEVGS